MKSEVCKYIYIAVVTLLLAVAVGVSLDVPTPRAFVYDTDRMSSYIGLTGLAIVLGSVFVRPHTRFVAIDAAVTAIAAVTVASACHNGGVAAGYSLSEALPYLLLYVVCRSFFSSCPKRGEVAAETLLFIFTVFEASVGLRQAYGLAPSLHGLFSVTGTFFNPGPYAGFIAMGMTTALGFVIRHRRMVARTVSSRRYTPAVVVFRLLPFVAASLALLAAVVVLPATESRAAWLAAATGTLVAVVSDSDCRKALGRIRLLSLKSLAVVSAAVVALWGAYLMKERSADGRLLIWKVEARAIAGHPLIGVGPGNFAGAFGREQAAYLSSDMASDGERSVAGCPEYGFNEYLRFGVETGLPGLLAAVALVLLVIRALFAQRKPSACGVAAMAVFAFFSYPLYFAPVCIFLVSFAASAASGSCRRIEGARGGSAVVSALAVAATVSVLFALPIFEKRAAAYDRWGAVTALESMKRYDRIAEDGERLYDDMRHNFRFLFSYGYALFKCQRHAESNRVLEEGASVSCDPMFRIISGRNYEMSEDTNNAEKCYLYACDMVPGRLYPRLLLMRMYAGAGRNAEAAEAAERLLATVTPVMTPAMAEMREEAELFLESVAGERVK